MSGRCCFVCLAETSTAVQWRIDIKKERYVICEACEPVWRVTVQTLNTGAYRGVCVSCGGSLPSALDRNLSFLDTSIQASWANVGVFCSSCAPQLLALGELAREVRRGAA